MMSRPCERPAPHLDRWHFQPHPNLSVGACIGSDDGTVSGLQAETEPSRKRQLGLEDTCLGRPLVDVDVTKIGSLRSHGRSKRGCPHRAN
jgi:hypothetical protein